MLIKRRLFPQALGAGLLQLPGFGLPLGVMPDKHFPVFVTTEEKTWTAVTLLIREVCMLKLVEELTNKPEWWIKVRNPEIAQRWKQEALQVNWEDYREHADFTPAMADAVSSSYTMFRLCHGDDT